MNVIAERLSLLRKTMKEKNINWYFFTSDDFHGSEYVADYFKIREYYSGFTGENAFLLVSEDKAFLWTDGRFFIQAEKQLKDTGIVLMKMGEPGVPSVGDFIKENVEKEAVFAFDGRMVSFSLGNKIEEILAAKDGKILFKDDIAGLLWSDRPSLPVSNLKILPAEVTGESLAEKLTRIREKMSFYGTELHFLSSLDDIAWITNIRGNDVECNPVFMSYMFITSKEAFIFMEKEEVSAEVEAYLAENNVKILDYNNILSFLDSFDYNGKVLLDDSSVNYSCVKIIKSKAETYVAMNPSTPMKAVKNAVEIERLKQAYIKDSVAVTKFIYWLKNAIKSEKLTEISAADYLDNLRRGIEGFLDLSFPTISGYGSNGAIVHYSATTESNADLKPEGFLLVDSGGQYLDGTTDVTRTIALGALSEKMKLHYTKVAAGMLSLGDAKFLYGCTGRNLDILSRAPLWNLGIDFKHGTGHGVGYILNVHEGPQNIRWKYSEGMKEYPLEAGMITSDEPGVYIEGEYGIRIENVILTVSDKENEYGKFLKFEHLTFVPLEREALLKEELSEKELSLVNAYNEKVYETIKDKLDPEEAGWLYEITRPL